MKDLKKQLEERVERVTALTDKMVDEQLNYERIRLWQPIRRGQIYDRFEEDEKERRKKERKND